MQIRSSICFGVLSALLLATHPVLAQDDEITEGQTFTFVGIGDSITRAFNAATFFKDNPDVSWATGAKTTEGFLSHLGRLQKLLPQKKFTTYNYAVTGAYITDLAAQVKKANAVKPDYLTLLIGANDVCNWGPNYQNQHDQFFATLKQNIDSLVSANPKVKILMSSLPNVYRLWELSKERASCQRAWSFIGLCKQLLGRGLSDTQRRSFKDRWDHANSSLASTAALYPQHIKFSEAVSHYDFSTDDVSGNDCFHPSMKGQNIIAATTWKESWFANMGLADNE